MYKDFFGMKNTPFVRGIPVNALYSDAETEEINARLLSAAREQNFALLVGDSGMGKTTAIRRMRNGLSESEYTVLYIADSSLFSSPICHFERSEKSVPFCVDNTDFSAMNRLEMTGY